MSDPEYWAKVEFGHLETDDYEKMLAYGQANQLRIQNAIYSAIMNI